MRHRINSVDRVDKGLHYYTSIIFLLNITFILYTMVSLTSRMLLSGVAFLDTIPLAFYILPLMIFLPKLLFDYYRSRSAIFTILILLTVIIIFGMISILVRGFIIIVALNIVSIGIVFILGRFRPKSQLKSIGRKGFAWILILNSVGLLLPVSITLMGHFPIDATSYSESSSIFIEMPIGSYDYKFVNITPTPSLLSDFESSGFGVDLRFNTFDNDTIGAYGSWIKALSNSSIPYRITSSANRADYLDRDTTLLGSTELLGFHYGHHWSAILHTMELFDNLSLTIENLPLNLDMTLSYTEWNLLMNQTRTVNLQGFSDLVRRSLDAIDSSLLLPIVGQIAQVLQEYNINSKLVVEGFAIDDLIDSDTTIMKLCGISSDILTLLGSEFEVLCDRSRYSEGMAGDVGEYLVHTYSQSPLVNSLRLGVAGIETGFEDVHVPVYQSLEELASDIAIASGNGIDEIVVASLPSILSSFGNSGLVLLKEAIQSQDYVEITYTFRIFAFRAVVMAIDSFDFLMF